MIKINVRKLSNKKARKRFFIRAIANQRTPQASTQRNVLSFRCVLLLLILFLYSLALLHVVNLRFAIGRVRPHRSRLQTHTRTLVHVYAPLVAALIMCITSCARLAFSWLTIIINQGSR